MIRNKRLFFGALVIVILLLVVNIRNLQKELLTEKSGWKNNISTEKMIMVKGVVRSDGLDIIQKHDLNLLDVGYQITNLEDNLNLNINGYFLKSDKVSQFQGKCVRVLGRLADDWSDVKVDSYNSDKYFNRMALIPDKIEQLEFSSCHPYYDVKNKGTMNITGTIVRNNREIPYDNNDYELIMEGIKPKDLGYENVLEDFKLILTPTNNDLWSQIENNINYKVVVIGEINKSGGQNGVKVGYFTVKEIRPFIGSRKVPDGILPQQIVKTYSFDGVEYALYQRGNMNIPMDGNKSGILISNKNEKVWREYIEVKDLSEQANNLYSIDHVNGKYYLLAVDAGGAGSGEGIAKLIAIPKGSKSWSIQKCFYYGGQSSYDWSLGKGKSIVNLVNEYLKKYPKEDMEMTSSQCKNVELIFK